MSLCLLSCWVTEPYQPRSYISATATPTPVPLALLPYPLAPPWLKTVSTSHCLQWTPSFSFKHSGPQIWHQAGQGQLVPVIPTPWSPIIFYFWLQVFAFAKSSRKCPHLPPPPQSPRCAVSPLTIFQSILPFSRTCITVRTALLAHWRDTEFGHLLRLHLSS